MSINHEIQYLTNDIEKKEGDSFLNKLEISDAIVKKINNILSIDNLDEVFLLIEKYIENGKVIYKKYGDDIENKEKIIDFILKNISRLLNGLNVKRVHNSSSCNMINSLEKLSYREQLKKILFIKTEPVLKQNVIGGSCNNWVIFFHKLMNDITDNDKCIIYDFQINTRNNHGIIYLNIGKNKYIFEDTPRGFLLELIKKGDLKIKDKNKSQFFETVGEYKENVLEGLNNRDNLTYYIGNDWLQIKKRFGLLIIGYKTKEFSYINITGLKRISKWVVKKSTIKYMWKQPKLTNLDDIRELIASKVNNGADKDKITGIVKHFNDDKLLAFFN